MRPSMFLALLTSLLVIGNVIDVISGVQDSTPNMPFVVGGSVIVIALVIYMFKTPDRNFIPLRKVKQYLPEDTYEDFRKKGPFQ